MDWFLEWLPLFVLIGTWVYLFWAWKTGRVTAAMAASVRHGGGRSEMTTEPRCSFCNKATNEVRWIFAATTASPSVWICDECVGLCNEIIAGRKPKSAKTGSVDDLPTERLLRHLQPIEDTLQGKGNQLQQIVDILRQREVSWAQIGAALGISRQSAWERFS